jgi:hypothetical protein
LHTPLSFCFGEGQVETQAPLSVIVQFPHTLLASAIFPAPQLATQAPERRYGIAASISVHVLQTFDELIFGAVQLATQPVPSNNDRAGSISAHNLHTPEELTFGTVQDATQVVP